MFSAKSTKIVFTTDSLNRGGKERQLFILAKSLSDKGFYLRIIAKKFSRENYFKEYGLAPEIIKIFKGETWLKKFQCFRKIIISEKPDLLISWDFQTSFFALLLHKRYSFIFVNFSIQHGIRQFNISHILRNLICLISPYNIANSYAGLQANSLKLGKRRFVLYNGIEDKFINTLTKATKEKRRNQLIPGYALKPGTVYVTVANLVPFKDYFTVLKVLNKLKEQNSFYYLIIGDGSMRDEIVAAIKEYGLEKRIILTGKIENVSDYLFIGDIMIHSSRGEGISNAILEGMYSGLPVIATNVGGIPETVFPGSSLLFPYKNQEALLENLLNAPKLFADFDKESEEYKKHLSKFSVDTMVNKFEDIIRQVSEEAKGNRI